MSERKLQEIAKEKEAKRRKEYFEAHYERFRHKGLESKKTPEVKKIPKRPGEKDKELKKHEEKGKEAEQEKKAKKEKDVKEEEKEEEEEDERPPSRAPIELPSRSPARKLQDSRADSAQASKGRGKVAEGAKRFLARAVREAANDVERRAKKKARPGKEKSPSPRPGSTPQGKELTETNLDFLGSLATSVGIIVWATVD